MVVAENYDEMSQKAAVWFADFMKERPTASVVVATGNTPMGMYQAVAEDVARGLVDTSQMMVFQLDGYLGISLKDPRSLEAWCINSVIEPWNVSGEQFVRLPEDATNPDLVAREYDDAIRRAGGLDVAILGLGPNGHLGFNEPPSRPSSKTRVVALTEESLLSNARYWGDVSTVPRSGITAGMEVLLAARHILLLVSGEHKREILHQTVKGPVTPEVPSSYLQGHPSVTVFTDKAACSDDLL